VDALTCDEGMTSSIAGCDGRSALFVSVSALFDRSMEDPEEEEDDMRELKDEEDELRNTLSLSPLLACRDDSPSANLFVVRLTRVRICKASFCSDARI